MSFVLTAQFVLVNVVIAVLMKHLEESNKEAKEEAELEAELELEMKTLSPQPHSPLGSPFLWPGVEGPDGPDSPKPGAPHAAAHAGAASHFSLEHPTVSREPPLPRGAWDWWPVARWAVYRVGPSAPLAKMLRHEPSPARPQRWLPVLEAQGHPSKPRARVLPHPCPEPPAQLASPSWLLGPRLSFLFPSCFFLTLARLPNPFPSHPSTCLTPSLNPFPTLAFPLPLSL